MCQNVVCDALPPPLFITICFFPSQSRFCPSDKSFESKKISSNHVTAKYCTSRQLIRKKNYCGFSIIIEEKKEWHQIQDGSDIHNNRNLKIAEKVIHPLFYLRWSQMPRFVCSPPAHLPIINIYSSVISQICNQVNASQLVPLFASAVEESNFGILRGVASLVF